MCIRDKEIKALDKYQDIEFDFRGRDADFNTKVPVEIAGGNPVDLIIVANPILQQQYCLLYTSL